MSLVYSVSLQIKKTEQWKNNDIFLLRLFKSVNTSHEQKIKSPNRDNKNKIFACTFYSLKN